MYRGRDTLAAPTGVAKRSTQANCHGIRRGLVFQAFANPDRLRTDGGNSAKHP